MTATDVTIAKALVTALDAVTFSNDAAVGYAHDVTTDLDNVSAAAIWVDATLRHERQARDYWTTNVIAEVVAVAPQGETGSSGDADAEDEKDAWLAFIDDEVIQTIKSQSIEGKKALSIEFEQRMDTEKLRAMSLFYTKFQINFPLV